MISKLFKWAAAITCALPLVAGAETVGDWFFGGVEGSQVAVTNATWETSGVDVSSALEVDNGKIVVDNDGTDTLDLVPDCDAPDTNVLTRVTIKSSFPPNEVDELASDIVDAKTALALAVDNGVTNYYAYTGYDEKLWIPLSGGALPASDEDIITAIVELNAYKSKVTANFYINGALLTDDNDNPDIALFAPRANVTKVSFLGSCLIESVDTKMQLGVASVDGIKYATYLDAINASKTATDPTITVLRESDGETIGVGDLADYRNVNGVLTEISWVAMVVSNDGATTNKFETLAEAVTAYQAGNVIELLPGASSLTADDCKVLNAATTYKFKIDQAYATIFMSYLKAADGYIAAPYTYDENYIYYTVTEGVAKLNDTWYASFAAAYHNANDGDTLVVKVGSEGFAPTFLEEDISTVDTAFSSIEFINKDDAEISIATKSGNKALFATTWNSPSKATITLGASQTVASISAATLILPANVTLTLANGNAMESVGWLDGNAAARIILDSAFPAGNLRARLNNTAWKGTFELKNYGVNDAALTWFGNAQSTVCFNNVGATMQAGSAANNVKTLVIGAGGFEFDASYASGQTIEIPAKVTGSGELKFSATCPSLCTAKFTGDFSEFAGNLTITPESNFRVYIGSNCVGDGKCISMYTTATIPTGKTWTSQNGFVVGGTLTVNGTLKSGTSVADGVIYGTGNIVFGSQSSIAKPAASWKGRYTLNAVDVGSTTTQVPINNMGNASSFLTLKGVSGDAWFVNGDMTVQPELTIDGNVNFQNGSSSKTATFRKIAAGTGNLSLKSWANCTGITYGFTTLDADNYTGTIQLDGSVLTFNVGDILKVGAKPGGKILPMTVANNANVNMAGATLNGGQANLLRKNDGIYLANNFTVTVPSISGASATVTTDVGTPVDNGDGTWTVLEGATVTITYAADPGYELSGQSVYTINNIAQNSEVTITDTTTAPYVATFNGTSYTSLSAAVSAWAEAEAAAAFMNPVVLTADVTEDVTIPVNVNASVVPLQMQGSATINGTVTISAGATFKPLATVLFGGDVVVNGTLVRAGASTLSIGGDLTLAEGATLGATTLDAVDPVYAVAGAVEVEGVLNISLTSTTLAGGTYKVVTGASVTRDEEADVVVFLNDVENDNWVLSSTATELTITGAAATVEGEKFATFAEAVAAANGVKTITLLASASWTLTVGETLIVEAGAFTMTVTPPAGYALVETAVSAGVVAYTSQQYVARVQNPVPQTATYYDPVYYTSLAEAVANAESGALVTLLADDHVSFAGVQVTAKVPSNGSIVINKNLTINGAGFTVYGNTNAEIMNATGSSTPGYDMVADLVDGSNLLGFFVKSGNVTFTNITLTEFGDTAYVNKFGYTPIQTASAYTGTLTLTNVNFNKFNRTAVCVRGGTLAMTGGTIAGGTVNKNNGDYFQQPVEVRGGTATISGVTITGGNDISGNGGGAIVAWSATTVTNVIVNFTGVGIWADYPVITVTGDSTSVTATDKALFVEDGGTINVSAGTFTGALAIDAVPGSSISITGGTFSVDPSDYVASGYAANKSGDVWVVSEYVPPSGIDPESGTEIAVDTTKTPEEQAADAQAAAAAMDVQKTLDAASVDQTTWNSYFTKTAEKVNDVWVAKAELNPAVVLPVDGAEETPLTDMLESVAAAAVDTTGKTVAEVPTKAGLYYWISGATEVNAASYTPGTAVLGDGEAKPLARPTLTGENGKAFFKVCVDVVAPTQE